MIRFRTRLSVCIGIFLLAVGCDTPDTDDNIGIDNAADTLVDALGRKVALPENVNRVVSPFTMYTRLIAALGGCDKLVGVSHTCLLPEEIYGCDGGLEQLPDVGPFGANVELIAALNPDILFSFRTDLKAFTAKTNATVISVTFPDTMPMLDMFDRQIDIIGKALRLQKQADSLKNYFHTIIEPVTSVTAAIPDSARPSVYFAWTSWTGDILNTVCEFDPIELAGGINVARDARNFAKGERGILVSREHILKWNPDFIFVSRYQPQKPHRIGPTYPMPVSIEDVLNDPLLQSVKAVKNKRVYYTTAFCNWWPHQRALVQVLYMAKLFYPKRFADLDVEAMGDDIFKRFYGTDGLYSIMADDLQLHRWR